MSSDLPAILFVDDEPMILASLRRLVHQMPFRALFAQNAVEALRIVDQERPTVVLTDFGLGSGLDGIDLVRRVRARHPRTQCILHTARIDLPPEYGLDVPVLTKPCDPEGLKELLLGLLEDAKAGR